MSELHETKLGPTRFRCQFEADGQFFIAGIADDSNRTEVYHHHGTFKLRENTLTYAALNEGRPVRLGREGNDLRFAIDQTTELRLTRLSPFAKAK